MPAMGVIVFYSLGYRVDSHDLMQLIRGLGILIGAYLFTAWTAAELAKAIQFYQYEKKTGKPIYTGLIKYIRREDEINEWRKNRGLKPVKIKSPFFFGNIEK